jgi:hypothetical protein
MLLRMERFKEWTGLKRDLTNYRLNSSILVIRSVGFWPSQPSTSGTIQGVWPKITSCYVVLGNFHRHTQLQMKIDDVAQIMRREGISPLTLFAVKSIFKLLVQTRSLPPTSQPGF